MTPTGLRIDEIARALGRVQAWVERHDYRGYEPFDGLSSWARPLVRHSLLGERVLQQVVRQCPVNLRPLLGVRPMDSTKARGYMAWGYVILFRLTRQSRYLDRALACLEWLDEHRAPGFAHHAWGNHYDFVSRGGGYDKHDPIIVWTSLIGQAYLEAFEATGRIRFLDIAGSVCEWILALPRERTARGECLSYRAGCQVSIHNANMLGAAMLARTAAHIPDPRMRRVARAAMEYSCSRQRADGAWWYAEEPKYHWIDSFHTGYNLDSLKTYLAATGETEFRPHLERGLVFFKEHFVDARGRPRYYHDRTYPIDIQCAAQMIDTLAYLTDLDASGLQQGCRVAAWTITHMQARDGHFHYRHYPFVKAKTAMLHWGQATMFKALARLLAAMAPAGLAAVWRQPEATSA